MMEHSSLAEAGFRARRLSGIAALAVMVVAAGGCSKQSREAKFLRDGQAFLAKKDFQRAVLQFKNAIQMVPKDGEPHYQLSLVYQAIGDYNSAVLELERAIKLNPKHLAAQVKLAEIYTRTGDRNYWEQAQQKLRDVLTAAPDNADALKTLAIAEWELGDQQEAEKRLRESLANAPQNTQTAVFLAKLKLSQHNAAGAEQVLKDAFQRSPSADLCVAMAQFYIGQSKWTEAEASIHQALKLAPQHSGALLNLAYLKYRSGQTVEEENAYKQLAALPGEDLKPLHAIYLLRNGRIDEAIAELQKLVGQAPSDRQMRNRLVWAFLSTGRLTEAEKLLNTAIAKNPKDADALLQHAALLLQIGRDTEAQANLTQMIRVRPESGEAHYLLSKLHQKSGSSVLQRQELGEALKLNARLLPARIDFARALISTNAGKDALTVLNEAPEDQRDSIPLKVQRNWALLQLGDLVQARKGIDEILAKQRIPDVLLQDALLKRQNKSYDEARKSLREVLEKAPENIPALAMLMRTYDDQKQSPAGLKALRDYAQRLPQSAAVQGFLGSLLLERGDKVQARAALLAAKAASPNSAGVDLSLVRLDVNEGKLDDGAKRLQTVLAADPNNPLALLWSGHIDEMKGDHGAAMAHYRKVLELQSNNWAAMNNLAFLLANYEHRPDDALKYAQKAQELNPNDPNVSDTLGWVLYQKGLYSNAIPYLESSASKQPSAWRQYHLAMVYLKSGDTKRGRAALETALKMGRDFPEAKSAQELLASLH